MEESKYHDAVTRGIEYLDSQHARWWEKVDLKHLDMENVREHVLAQIQMTHLASTIEYSNQTYVWLIEHGFELLAHSVEFVELTREWILRIGEIKRDRL